MEQLSVTEFGCKFQSAGFIDENGKFHNLADYGRVVQGRKIGTSHEEYLEMKGINIIPSYWIVVHNSFELAVHSFVLPKKVAIKKLIDFWIACIPHMRESWFDPATGAMLPEDKWELIYLNYHYDEKDREEISIVDFINRFAPDLLNYFFDSLMNYMMSTYGN